MRPQETATVRGRAGPLPSALARVQKTRGGRLGSCSRFGAPAVASSSLASHKTHETGSVWLSEAPAICAQPCATDQIAKRRAALLQRPKAAASNFAPPAQVDNDATDGVSAGHLRPCCRLAAGPRAEAIARREAGNARRPSTRARWRGGGDTREPTPSPRRHEGGDAREPPPSP